MRTILLAMLALTACGSPETCSRTGAERCIDAVLSTCDGARWIVSGSCSITSGTGGGGGGGTIEPVDAGIYCDLASQRMPGEPDRACTAIDEGRSICPNGPAGFGYTCTSNHCWQGFADGVCSARAPGDGGVQCPDDPCELDGRRRCRDRVLSVCNDTCWVPTSLCDADYEANDFICENGRGPQIPSQPCTSVIEGKSVCPAGGTSGYGYVCAPDDCWQFYFDGACGGFALMSDGGRYCYNDDRCDIDGASKCEGGIFSTCDGVCWSPIDACAPDAGP